MQVIDLRRKNLPMVYLDYSDDVPLREKAPALGRRLVSRLFGTGKEPAAVPQGRRVYAVGDIHGRLDLLKQLWAQIEADAADVALHKTVVFVGDYVDRGPDSKGVIDFLINARLNGGVVLCLRGNHDQAILDFMSDANFYRNWKTFGAPETLLSYGVRLPLFDRDEELERARREFLEKCPESHVKFLMTLPYSHSIGGYFFAHAGARPGVPLDEQDPQDLLWIRDEFLNCRNAFDKVVVHGHTPQDTPKHRSHRIGIDMGAYATGCLAALVLEGTDHRFLLANEGRGIK